MILGKIAFGINLIVFFILLARSLKAVAEAEYKRDKKRFWLRLLGVAFTLYFTVRLYLTGFNGL